jgi:hypothetical protein
VAAVVSWHDAAPVVTVVLAGATVVAVRAVPVKRVVVVPEAEVAPELQAAAAVTERNPKSTKANFAGRKIMASKLERPRSAASP